MPINSSFKRSLLNSQPIVKKIDGIVSTPHNPDDGYAGVNCGFAELIERQDGIEVERTGDELSDSITIDKTKEYDGIYNIGRKKPEIILTLQPSVEISQQEKKYRDFISSVEEYDYFYLFNSLTTFDDPAVKSALARRMNVVNDEMKYLQTSLDSMSNLVDSRKELFRSISLTKNKTRLNKIASSFRKNYYREYSEDPQGNSIDLSSTLLGFESFDTVKNSSILYSLAMAAVLPGTTIFQTGTSAGSNTYVKFDALKIKKDTVSDFLQLLSGAKYIASTDFFKLESYISSGNRTNSLILLAEALSYELITTKGLGTINTTNENIFSFLNTELGLVSQIANENSTGNLFSIFKNDKFYELEPDDEMNGSIKANGFVASLIDSKINNATFDFIELENISKKNSDKIVKYADFVRKIRLLDEQENLLTSQNIIARICDAIVKSLGDWATKDSLNSSDAQFSLLCKLSKNNTNNGKRLRQLVFKEIFNIDTLDAEEYDVSGFRDNILKPIYVTAEPRFEELAQPEIGLGTSITIKNLFKLKEDIVDEITTPANLFKLSHYPETINRVGLSSFEYAKNFNSVISGNGSGVISFSNDAHDKKINASNLNCASMLADSLKSFNDINNQTRNAPIDSNDTYAISDSYINVSNIISKFERISLLSFGDSSIEDGYTEYLGTSVLLGNICDDLNRGDTLKLNYEFEMSDDAIGNILKDNEEFSTIKREMLTLYSEIYQNVGLRPGQKTRTFKLTSTKIKFLIFELLLSILSLFESATIKRQFSPESDKFIATIRRSDLIAELNELKQISKRKGTESYISEGLRTQLKKITVALGTCSNSADITASRISHLYAIAQNYVDSISDFLKITSQKDTLNKINNISKERNAFSNLTPELASAKKIAYMNFLSSPLSIKNTTRLEKTYSYFSEILESELRKFETSIVAVGLPLSTTHYLRNNNNFNKEYIEINVSKRNTIKSEVLINDTIIRFSQFLEVIPQFTKSENLMSIIHDFKYLCYENGDWRPKSIGNAINFVSRTTGLDIKNSSIILINHAFDALAKCHVYNKTGILLNDLLCRNEYFAISNEGKEFYDSVNSRINLNINGTLSFSDFTEKVYNGYKVKKYSELGKTLIDKTDQPTHRLLNSVMSDSLFSIESLKNCLFSTQPFERIYCLPISKLDLSDFRTGYSETNIDINEISATIKLVSS